MKTPKFLAATAAIAATLMCGTSSNAFADIIVSFQVPNVTFQSGATASGMFTLDETLGETTAVNIQYTGAGGFHFTDPTTASTGCSESLNGLTLAFCQAGTHAIPFLILTFSNAIGTGTDTITGGSYRDDNQHLNDSVTGGAIAPVPEPMSLALLGVGVAALGVVRRRNTKPA